jgi:protein-L-isoaspartate(D-aspartate) O-methyltransferase
VSVELARRVEAQGIRDPAVLSADEDRPLPIGFGQTISQPFVVAFMSERLALTGTERVLEVGTGSGYQTAVLARLAGRVFSVEVVEPLAVRARELLLDACALRNVELRTGDGSLGWPEAAPFDRILVTAAAAAVPQALLDQLAPGGRMILPLGEEPEVQVLRLMEKGADGRVDGVDLLPVRFVRLV